MYSLDVDYDPKGPQDISAMITSVNGLVLEYGTAVPYNLRTAPMKDLMAWFTTHFFMKKTLPPLCGRCGDGRTMLFQSHPEPTFDERCDGVRPGDVSAFWCPTCYGTTRFSRYRNPRKLFQTRTGLSMEASLLFVSILRGIGREGRVVTDGNVNAPWWCEYWEESARRWVSCCPYSSEHALSQPLAASLPNQVVPLPIYAYDVRGLIVDVHRRHGSPATPTPPPGTAAQLTRQNLNIIMRIVNMEEQNSVVQRCVLENEEGKGLEGGPWADLSVIESWNKWCPFFVSYLEVPLIPLTTILQEIEKNCDAVERVTDDNDDKAVICRYTGEVAAWQKVATEAWVVSTGVDIHDSSIIPCTTSLSDHDIQLLQRAFLWPATNWAPLFMTAQIGLRAGLMQTNDIKLLDLINNFTKCASFQPQWKGAQGEDVQRSHRYAAHFMSVLCITGHLESFSGQIPSLVRALLTLTTSHQAELRSTLTACANLLVGTSMLYAAHKITLGYAPEVAKLVVGCVQALAKADTIREQGCSYSELLPILRTCAAAACTIPIVQRHLRDLYQIDTMAPNFGVTHRCMKGLAWV